MITVEGLTKSFGDEVVLNDISAEFYKGKTNLIIGESGSGKSVFLKCMLGLFERDAGKIVYDCEGLNEMTSASQSKLREKMGMVFQHSALFDSMNVEENVIFPLTMFTKMTMEEKLERVNSVLKRVNLENVNKKMPSEISGGMQKRVAIARAIVNYPEFLFCDEPNSGLDPKTAILIDNLIQEITHENNITTVIISHDMNSVMEIGQTIIFLENSKLAWRGSNEDIFITDNQAVTNFVYSSNLFKKVRRLYV
ncbi:MAG: ATP-binding cassette domain-containing protein, partial [Flavobacteriaceae bacterium]|nr:ATP-binding cassette domain-containing protein [Flavobacteriaceae bacterium]